MVNMRPTLHTLQHREHFLVIGMVPGLDLWLTPLGANGTPRGAQFVTPAVKLDMSAVIVLLGHLIRVFSFSGHLGSGVRTLHRRPT